MGIVFENYLKQERIDYEGITVSKSKTADYKIRKNNLEIIAEFKEFCISDIEKKWLKSDNSSLGDPDNPGYPENKSIRRIREKIRQASKQLENNKTYPCICVLDNVNITETHINLSTIAVMIAMFGDLSIRYSKNLDFKEEVLYGNAPPQILRKADGTGSNISAVAIVDEIDPVYENNKKEIEDFVDKRIELSNPYDIEEEIKRHFPCLNKTKTYRLRIIFNPKGKKELPPNFFSGNYDEKWIYNGKEKKFIKV